MKTQKDELIGLAIAIVEVLDKRCKPAGQFPPWTGFKNSKGVEVGVDIEHLIAKAKRILQQQGL